VPVTATASSSDSSNRVQFRTIIYTLRFSSNIPSSVKQAADFAHPKETFHRVAGITYDYQSSFVALPGSSRNSFSKLEPMHNRETLVAAIPKDRSQWFSQAETACLHAKDIVLISCLPSLRDAAFSSSFHNDALDLEMNSAAFFARLSSFTMPEIPTVLSRADDFFVALEVANESKCLQDISLQCLNHRQIEVICNMRCELKNLSIVR
jgi:hypothetical protein